MSTATSPLTLHRRLSAIERVTADKLPTLPYWDSLDEKQRSDFQNVAMGISSALTAHWRNTLQCGKLIYELQQLTAPHGQFQRTFDYLWGNVCSFVTGYRWRNVYVAVRDRLNEQVVELAIASGIKLVSGDDHNPFGRYEEVVSSLPAPGTTMRDAYRWLEQFRKAAAELPKAPRNVSDVNPMELGKASFIKERNNYRRLPQNPKVRSAFIDQQIGYLLWLDNRSEPATFQPVAPPEEWKKIERGRPRHNPAPAHEHHAQKAA